MEQSQTLIEKAVTNLRNTVSIALQYTENERALVIYDTHHELANILTAAYRIVLPNAQFLDFDSSTKETIIAVCDELSPKDLVVLIQSTDFRLNEFRIRIHLFQRELKVIDHLHLSRNSEDSWETYIKALEYDIDWYRGVGKRLKSTLEAADEIRLQTNDCELIVKGGVELPKLNIGDYEGMKNIGGTFPIGEVFTEAKDLNLMNGSVMIYAFAGQDYHVTMHDPFRIDIKDGYVASWSENAPKAFVDIVSQVKTNEGARIREIGFGMNRAITKDTPLNDITAFERTLGTHLSLGEKHTVYKKPGITADKTRFHVDLFPATKAVYADDVQIFDGKTYTV